MNARTGIVTALGLVSLTGSLALAAPSSYERPGFIERVSVASDGTQSRTAPYPITCLSPLSVAGSDVSGDGRYMVFQSNATNLTPSVAGPKVGQPLCNVFWRDRVTKSTKLVSVGVAGTPAAGQSGEASISGNGRYVAFASDAANLVPGDTNRAWDVFVRDMRTGVTVRVSVTTSGQQAGGPSAGNLGSFSPSISADGRHVAFDSDASNLVTGDTNGIGDVFVRDLEASRTSRVSLTSSGAQAVGSGANNSHPSISADGRYVAFISSANNLAAANPAAPAGTPEVYRRDRKTGTTALVSLASNGDRASFSGFPSCRLGSPPLATLPSPVPPVFNTTLLSLCGSDTLNFGGHAMSNDGRFVVFESNATNLVPNDTNYIPPFGGNDVFVRDVQLGRTERVSVNSFGQESPDSAKWAAISGDGNYVIYSHEGGVSVGCQPLPVDVTAIVGSCQGRRTVVYDRRTGFSEVISTPTGGRKSTPGSCYGIATPVDPANLNAFPGGISSDGRIAGFQSEDAGLVAGDTNNSCDYFVRDRGAALGVGGLTGTQPTSWLPPGCGLPVCPPLPTGAGMQQVRVVPRPGLEDLFIRWDVSRMAPVASSPGGLLYELRFAVGGQHYAVRAQRVPGADFDPAGGASFGLFREAAPGVWTHVASLHGGYGTIGDSVVTAVPLSAIGGNAQLTDVTAYTAVGSYLSGPTKVLDSLRLSR